MYNNKIYILDRHLNPVPAGVAGELYIGGIVVVRGYLNRRELTAERFIPDPFSDTPGARLYRSGDLARWLPDGNLDFLGRIDHQVKIRGFRIELGEIEAALNVHPAVREAVVITREDSPGDKRLVAYVVPASGQSPTTTDLRRHLLAQLPDYMVPAVFMFLEALPIAANGKLDRRMLPAPLGERPELHEAYAAPRTPMEEAIAGVWRDLLQVEEVGIHDSFFDLGGHSLILVQLHSRLRELLQRDIAIVDLLQYPTVSAFAAFVEQGQAAPPDLQESYERGESRRALLQQRRAARSSAR